MADWDYKMQIECANSFIVPIKNKVRITVLKLGSSLSRRICRRFSSLPWRS